MSADEAHARVLSDAHSLHDVVWTIAGQDYRPKIDTPDCFAFQVIAEPGQAVPHHIHAEQDEYVLVQEGSLRIVVGEQVFNAGAGDVVHMPRRVPHSYANRTEATAKALFWVAPARDLASTFAGLDDISDPEEMHARIKGCDLEILGPPEA